MSSLPPFRPIHPPHQKFGNCRYLSNDQRCISHTVSDPCKANSIASHCLPRCCRIHLSAAICESVQGRLCLGVFSSPPSNHSVQRHVERLNAPRLLLTQPSSIWQSKLSLRMWCWWA